MEAADGGYSLMDAILYLHHLPLTSGVTRDHFRRLRWHNPFAEIIPLCFDKDSRTKEWQYRHCDELVLEWFHKNQPKHERFFIIEYDTLCTQPLKDFYGPAYDLPVVGSIIVDPRSDKPLPIDSGMPKEWHWFSHCKSLSIWPYLRGILPVCGAMFSNDALAAMVKVWKTVDGFDPLCAEARIGTLACMAGYEPQRIRPDGHEFIYWKRVKIRPPGVGIYHCIK